MAVRIGDERFAVRADEVAEIVAAATLLRMPGQPSILEGFLNLRGEAVAIVNFRRLFDMGAKEVWAHTPFLILKGEGARIGLAVGAGAG